MRAAALTAAFYDARRSWRSPARCSAASCAGGAAGVIVETEAYHHSEPACHAHVGLTARTARCSGRPGCAYVYRSYGIHALLNVVCEEEDVGAAVLIRALEPLGAWSVMRARRRRRDDLCSGPGKLTQALGIGLEHNGTDLSSGPVRIEPRRRAAAGGDAGPRIGITKARRSCRGGSARRGSAGRVAARGRRVLDFVRHEGNKVAHASRRLSRSRPPPPPAGVSAATARLQVAGASAATRRSPGAAEALRRRARRGLDRRGLGRRPGAPASAAARLARAPPGGWAPAWSGRVTVALRRPRPPRGLATAWTNDLKIAAGKVPPATESPWNSVSIGVNASG